MITHWVQVGADCIAVDDQKGICGVIKWLDGEIVVQHIKAAQIGVQHVREPSAKGRGLPDEMRIMGMRSIKPKIIS